MIETAQAAPRRALFVATILTGSFLLFLVQPMVARMALPRLGGAPNVWNSAMLVYQALLLAGYGYAHRLGRMPLRRQAKVHVALLLLSAVTLPIALNGRLHLHFYPAIGRVVAHLRPQVFHIDEESFNLATFLAMRAGVRAGARCWRKIFAHPAPKRSPCSAPSPAR